MKVYLNALGLITPIGANKHEVATSLFKGISGVTARTDLIAEGSALVGAITNPLPSIPTPLSHLDCRNNRLALAALLQIEEPIRAMTERFSAERIAVVMGTSTAGIAEGEEALTQRKRSGSWPATFRYSQQEVGNLARFVADWSNVTGPTYTIATACSSSAKALASAQRLLTLGACDAAIVGGSDSLCRMTLNGFASLEALSPNLCNPFSLNRDGINIGEGAAIFLVSRIPSPVALLGVGESSDAYHTSAPDPDGAGAILAMRAALKNAGLTPAAIAYINLHGTATSLNDVMEGRAVAEVFGRHLPCSATKPLTGHTLGAAGAIEAAFLWLMLHPEYATGIAPPHLWDGVADPAVASLNLVPREFKLQLTACCALLSNSFAFGGSNASVILGRGY